MNWIRELLKPCSKGYFFHDWQDCSYDKGHFVKSGFGGLIWISDSEYLKCKRCYKIK